MRIDPLICFIVVEVRRWTVGVFSCHLACQVNRFHSAGHRLKVIATRGSCFYLWQSCFPGAGNRRVLSAKLFTFSGFVPGTIWESVIAPPLSSSVSQATGCRSCSGFLLFVHSFLLLINGLCCMEVWLGPRLSFHTWSRGNHNRRNTGFGSDRNDKMYQNYLLYNADRISV